MAHPLLGADVATLARVFRDGGGADRRLAALGISAGLLAGRPVSGLDIDATILRVYRSPVPEGAAP